MDDGEFKAFDEALSNYNNLDGFYNPASLIERFLASLDGAASAHEGNLGWRGSKHQILHTVTSET